MKLCAMGKKLSKSLRRPSEHIDDQQTMKEASNQRIHTNPVLSLDIHGDVLYSGNSNGELHSFSLHKKQLESQCGIHEKEITRILTSMDPSTIFTASRDKLITHTDISHPKIMQKFIGHELIVTGLSSNTDFTKLVSGSRDCSVKLWDVESGKILMTRHVNRNIVTDMKWLNTENVIVQCSEDKVMKLWDARNLKNTSTFPIKQYFQTCCDVDIAKNQILTGNTGGNGSGCEIMIWDLRQMKAIQTMKGHTERITECKFFKDSRNNQRAITVSNDCSVKVWNLSSYDCLCTEFISGAKGLTSIAMDGNSVCVGTYDDGIHVFNYNSELQRLDSLYCI